MNRISVSLNSSCHWWCPHELHIWPISSSALHSHVAQMRTVGPHSHPFSPLHYSPHLFSLSHFGSFLPLFFFLPAYFTGFLFFLSFWFVPFYDSLILPLPFSTFSSLFFHNLASLCFSSLLAWSLLFFILQRKYAPAKQVSHQNPYTLFIFLLTNALQHLLQCLTVN